MIQAIRQSPNWTPSVNAPPTSVTGIRKTEIARTTAATAPASAATQTRALSAKSTKKSESTVNAYAADLDLATEVLGAETPIGQLTLDDITRFNASEPVLRTKSGRDKALPTIERSRRVLRLALVFAEQQGAIESAPIPPKKRAPKDEAAPVPTTPEPAAKPKGKRAVSDLA